MSRCLVTALAGLTLATATMAAEQKVSFESLDTNSDGKVSVHEASFNDALFVAFKDLDANRDGELTKDEFAGHQRG